MPIRFVSICLMQIRSRSPYSESTQTLVQHLLSSCTFPLRVRDVAKWGLKNESVYAPFYTYCQIMPQNTKAHHKRFSSSKDAGPMNNLNDCPENKKKECINKYHPVVNITDGGHLGGISSTKNHIHWYIIYIWQVTLKKQTTKNKPLVQFSQIHECILHRKYKWGGPWWKPTMHSKWTQLIEHWGTGLAETHTHTHSLTHKLNTCM